MDKMLPGNLDQCIKGLMDISRALTSDRSREDILDLIVMVAAKMTGAAVCSIWLIDDTTRPQVMRLQSTQAADPDYVKDRSLRIQEGVVGLVASQNRTLTVADVLSDLNFKEKETARKLGLVSMLGVPIRIKDGRVTGVLNCFTTTPHDFSEIEINLMAAVAQQAGVAIFNAELMLKTQAAEEELQTRKLVERAKEILMRRREMNGDAAYQWLQKRSMDSRKSMRAVAEAILLSEDLGYYSSIPHALNKKSL
ncbi:MAG: GAF and ANTAR domain-containing protein [Desulfobacterales bacterium]|nr:GAF and ANTAR domain-containing protein [Desulfobacterales bacterium]